MEQRSAVATWTDIPRLWWSSNLGLECRNQRQNEWDPGGARWGPVCGGLMGNSQIGREAWDTVWGRRFSKCSEDLPKKGEEDVEEEKEGGAWQRRDVPRPWVGHAGEVMCRSGGWHQVRGCGRLQGREARARRSPPRLVPTCPRIHWSTFLNIVQQTMESGDRGEHKYHLRQGCPSGGRWGQWAKGTLQTLQVHN